MRIDKHSCQICCFSDAEAEELRSWAVDTLEGREIDFHAPWFTRWCKQCGFEDRVLVVVGTLAPAMALLGAVNWYKGREER